MQGIQAECEETAEGESPLCRGKHLNTWSHPIMQLVFVNSWLEVRWMIERFPVSAQVSLKRRQALLVTTATAAETEQIPEQVGKSRDLHPVGFSIWLHGRLWVSVFTDAMGTVPTVLNFSKDTSSTKGNCPVDFHVQCALASGFSSAGFSWVECLVCVYLFSALYLHSLAYEH